MATDLRMLAVGAAAWWGGIVGTLGRPLLLLPAVAVLLGAAVVARRLGAGTRTAGVTVAALLVVLLVVATVAATRAERTAGGPVPDLAAQRSVVSVTGTVTSDPRPYAGPSASPFADPPQAEGRWLRLRVTEVTGRGRTWSVRSPVLVLGDAGWAGVPLGAEVSLLGRLEPSDGPDLAAVLAASGPPQVRTPPDVWWAGADRLRASLRAAVAHRPAPERILVPALVSGDDAGLDEQVAQEFRTTGLTHLLAVSGTNLTLVVGLLLGLARAVGVRGRWLLAVGALGIVGFVLLARTEPSVLRAAVMGSVGLLALTPRGQRKATRTLGVAMVLLLLLEPGLATSAGFALSVLATGGILLLAPPWRDALARWLPRWLAEAVAVPTAAQLACTPVVAAISDEVSLVAVAANMAAAPAVGPATVLGLAGGLVGLVVPPLGAVLGTVATWCVGWIVLVADRGAALPAASVPWSATPAALALLVVVSVVLALLGPRLAARPGPAVALCLVLCVVVLRPGTPAGWLPGGPWPPPEDWAVVACDVGQGDALALRTGPGSAVVVDAGPDPAPVDRCLDGLGVDTVPLLVLTHFHADHVGGVAGVLDGRRVDAVAATGTLDPPTGVDLVSEAVAGDGLGVAAVAQGQGWRIGELALQVLWPRPGPPRPGTDGSAANDASVVLLAEVAGVRVLLTGDLEPPGQAALAAAVPELDIDVLKVPHHGSRAQDLDLLTGLTPEVSLVSVGADNDYGHPDVSLLDALTGSGSRVLRTDLDGAVAVLPPAGEDPGLRVVTEGGASGG